MSHNQVLQDAYDGIMEVMERKMISFGNYLLSKEREDSLRQTNIEVPGALPYEDRFRNVYDADLYNFKTKLMKQQIIPSDLEAG